MLVEVAYLARSAIILFRAFVATIRLRRGGDDRRVHRPEPVLPRDLPALRPVTITVILTASVAIYNDFVNPLYFLPGSDNATVQLTLFFQSQFNTRWNLCSWTSC